jgi:hypothetical protein
MFQDCLIFHLHKNRLDNNLSFVVQPISVKVKNKRCNITFYIWPNALTLQPSPQSFHLEGIQYKRQTTQSRGTSRITITRLCQHGEDCTHVTSSTALFLIVLSEPCLAPSRLQAAPQAPRCGAVADIYWSSCSCSRPVGLLHCISEFAVKSNSPRHHQHLTIG